MNRPTKPTLHTACTRLDVTIRDGDDLVLLDKFDLGEGGECVDGVGLGVDVDAVDVFGPPRELSDVALGGDLADVGVDIGALGGKISVNTEFLLCLPRKMVAS